MENIDGFTEIPEGDDQTWSWFVARSENFRGRDLSGRRLSKRKIEKGSSFLELP